MTYAAQGALFFAAMKGGDAVYGNSQEFAREIAAANNVIAAIGRTELPAAIPWENAKQLYVAADELLRGAMNTAYRQAENTTFLEPAEQARVTGNVAAREYQRYLAPLAQILSEVREQGGTSAMVPSALFQKNIPRAMEAATRAYEALAYLLDIRPGAVRFMDAAVKLYNKVGVAWARAIRTIRETILDPSLNALDEAARIYELTVKGVIVGGAAYIAYVIYKGSR